MKKIGLIGGISWVSTYAYYKLINQKVNQILGGVHSAEMFIYSFEMEEVKEYIEKEDWKTYGEKAAHYAEKLEYAGAEILGICSNTGHNLVQAISERVKIPIVHIAEATADEIIKEKMQKIGLLGTKSTMLDPIPYNQILTEKHNISVIVPEEDEIKIVQDVILNELVANNIKAESREKFRKIISNLQSRGAEGIVLGCTEIPLLINQEHCDIKIFDTTMIHAYKLVEVSLND